MKLVILMTDEYLLMEGVAVLIFISLLVWFASKLKLLTVQNEEQTKLLKRLAKKADPEGEDQD